MPSDLSPVRAISLAELNNDSVLDLAVVRNDRVLVRVSDKDHGASWEEQAIVHSLPDAPRLVVADLDNNGSVDFVCGSDVSMRDEKNIVPAEALDFTRVLDVTDVNGDGKLDLLGIDLSGRPVKAINQSSKNYHWQVVRPRSVQATGDQRINSFGVGGEMEIRSGLLVQKQPITGPLLHFGLGEQPSTDVIRVGWPNGTVRADFEIKADQEVVTEQRL